MKKVLLTASLVALSANGQASASFDGMYAGVKLDHAWTELKAKDGDLELKPKSFEADLLFGQNFQNADVVYGFEAQIGRGFSDTERTWKNVSLSSSTVDVKFNARRLWKFGVSGRWGKVFNNAFVYGHLGLHANQYDTRLSVGKESKKNSFFSWAVAPGVGAEFSIAHGVNARVEYTYEHSFTQPDFKGHGYKVSLKEPTTHMVSVGISFAL